MKITLESNIDDLEKKFEVSHDAYLMQTSEHMATFTALTKTDAQAARLIDMRLRKLQRLQVLAMSLLDLQCLSCHQEMKTMIVLNTRGAIEQWMSDGRLKELALRLENLSPCTC